MVKPDNLSFTELGIKTIEYTYGRYADIFTNMIISHGVTHFEIIKFKKRISHVRVYLNKYGQVNVFACNYKFRRFLNIFWNKWSNE